MSQQLVLEPRGLRVLEVVVQFSDDTVDRLCVRNCRWFVVAIEALHDQLPMLRG
jgi:hypothetical protein